jgi:hypothetical protein
MKMMKTATHGVLLAMLLPAVGSRVHAGVGAKSSDVEGGKSALVRGSQSDGRWEVHGGFGVRQAYDLRVRSSNRTLAGGSYSLADAGMELLNRIGPVNAQADRSYDDGFVNIGSLHNMTTYWGYEDAGQVGSASSAWDASQPWDAPGNRSLYLSRTGEAGIAGYSRGDDTGEEAFPYLEARRLWQGDESDFWDEKGISFGWSWVPTQAGLVDSLALLRTRVVDEYYLHGVIPPTSPYEGPPLPPGPLLGNLPHNRVSSETGSELIGRSSTDLDFDLHTLSLGGIWRLSPDRWARPSGFRVRGLDLQAGLSLNFGKLTMDSRTTVTENGRVVGAFSDRSSESEFLPGLYVSLGATIDIGEPEDWMIFTAGRFDHAGSIKTDSGLRSAEVELKGFSWTLGIGRSW